SIGRKPAATERGRAEPVHSPHGGFRRGSIAELAMAHRLLIFALVGALASAMAACASKVPVRARGPSGGVQGGAWELVVPGPEVALALAKADTSAHPAYMTRRDAALGATTPSWAPVATGAGRPTTIGRPRSISLGRSHE